MVALVLVEALLARLALPEDEGVLATIESGIAGATSYVEAKLKTSVAEGTAEDWFAVDATTMEQSGVIKLLLSNGFVRGVTVFTAESLSGTQSEILALKIHDEKGLVSVLSNDVISPGYLKVAYSYGFASVEDVPQWLQEVAMAYTVQLMSMQQVNDGKDELSKLYSFVKSHGVEVLDAHLRRGSFAIRPLL